MIIYRPVYVLISFTAFQIYDSSFIQLHINCFEVLHVTLQEMCFNLCAMNLLFLKKNCTCIHIDRIHLHVHPTDIFSFFFQGSE